MTIQEIAFRAWQAFDMPEGVTPGLDETVFFDPPNCVFPFGAHGCEVEVDRETGKVEITGYIAVDDCGNVINPMIVDWPGARRRRPRHRPGALRGAPCTTRAASS